MVPLFLLYTFHFEIIHFDFFREVFCGPSLVPVQHLQSLFHSQRGLLLLLFLNLSQTSPVRLTFQTGLKIKHIWSLPTKLSKFLLFTVGSPRTLAFLFHLLQPQLLALWGTPVKLWQFVSCLLLLISFYLDLLHHHSQQMCISLGIPAPDNLIHLHQKSALLTRSVILHCPTWTSVQPHISPSAQALLSPGSWELLFLSPSLLPDWWNIFSTRSEVPPTPWEHPGRNVPYPNYPAPTSVAETPPTPMESRSRLHFWTNSCMTTRNGVRQAFV